jgi:hypothetical protein
LGILQAASSAEGRFQRIPARPAALQDDRKIVPSIEELPAAS